MWNMHIPAFCIPGRRPSLLCSTSSPHLRPHSPPHQRTSTRTTAAAAPRKLLQWGNRLGGGYGYGGQQYVAQRTAAVMTQQAIRTAVEAPAGYPNWNFDATRQATNVGQATSAIAAYQPCALAYGCYGGWYGGGYYGRKLLRGG
jgi:hypothetical protein